MIFVIPCQNNENHEVPRIPLQNHENHKNLTIPFKNYENHEIHRNFKTESRKS